MNDVTPISIVLNNDIAQVLLQVDYGTYVASMGSSPEPWAIVFDVTTDVGNQPPTTIPVALFDPTATPTPGTPVKLQTTFPVDGTTIQAASASLRNPGDLIVDGPDAFPS